MKDPNRIFLTGMRGSGKTSVGKVLAERTGLEFIDTDEETEKRLNITINELFKNNMQDLFRKTEAAVVKELSLKNNVIISTGGGTLENPETLNILKNEFVIWLKGSNEILFSRIKNSNRPALTDLNPFEEFVKISSEREKLYEQALISIDTGNLSVSEVADAIQQFRKIFQNNNIR